MEKFYFEKPNISRKEDAQAFINEFYEYNSDINGVGGLHRYMDDYEGWLEKLEDDYTREPSEDKVPARTFFLVREADSKIIGMINIRLALNKRLEKFGMHIGYSIRPTERGNGYNKINLYLGLKVCKKFGIEKALMDADIENPASWKTMEALGGKLIKEYFDDEGTHYFIKNYEIDVDESLKEYSKVYEPMISREIEY